MASNTNKDTPLLACHLALQLTNVSFDKLSRLTLIFSRDIALTGTLSFSCRVGWTH